MTEAVELTTENDPKETRRRYGSGSIMEKDGKFIGRIDIGWTITGKRRRKVVVAPSRKECAKRIRDEIRKANDANKPTGNPRTTVKTWCDKWAELTEPKTKPRTWETTSGAIRRWIIPTIGHIRLADLTPTHIRSVAAAQVRAGRSTTTARRTHAVLKTILKAATVEGFDVPARVLMLEAPPVAIHDRGDIERDDALALLDAASTLPESSRWVAALLQGMRQAECLGLTWSCVDLDGSTIDISWQLQSLPYADRAAKTFSIPSDMEARRLEGAYHLVRPKSEKGKRIIPLVPWMTAALAAWKVIAPTSKHGLVWPRPNGRPQNKQLDTRAWVALQDRAQVAKVEDAPGVDGAKVGRRYHGHEMRHTTATLLLEAGIDTEIIKAIMGHSSIITTRGYQHVNQELARRALVQIASTLRLTLPVPPDETPALPAAAAS